MIQSFDNTLTEKVFNGEVLIKKERKACSDLNLAKAQQALKVLDKSTEKQLLTTPSLAYHSLSGMNRYSIDANGRKSKWRITFTWVDSEKTDVELVKIENTH